MKVKIMKNISILLLSIMELEIWVNNNLNK
jgi:hypothetical protein